MAEGERSESYRFVAPVKREQRDLDRARESLRGWLRERLPAADDLRLSPITMPAGTGVANETLLFDATWTERGTTASQGFATRVATAAPLYLDADIEIHYRMYKALQEEPGVPVPGVYGYEPDPALLGAPFFVMEKIDGEIPADRPSYRESGFVYDATPDQRRRLFEDAVRTLARLHEVGNERVPFLDRPDLGRSGLEQELAYWRRSLDWAEAGRPHEVLERGWEWLQSQLPADPPTSLSWGDSRIANMIFRDFRVVSVLDWDGVSLAGSEADLAWWIIMDHSAATELPGIGTPDEFVDLWQELTGRKVLDLHYYLVFTAFRLGAIMLRLFQLMAADGLLSADLAAEQGANSGSVQQLAMLLGLTPPGPVTATLPDLRR